MTGKVPNIEQIVAEVVRRLMLLSSESETRTAEMSAAGAPAIAAERVARKRDELTLDARVITIASLHGRLEGIRCVWVDPRAVVTPSVKDDLRKRGIRLEVRVAPEKTPGSADLTVVRFLRLPDAVRASGSLPLPGNSVERSCDALASAVQNAAESVRDERQVAVVLTDESLAAVCLLNRYPHVRAVQARSASDVRRAIEVIGANLLVVDPREVTVNQWHAVIETLRKDLPRRCPATFRAGSP